MLSSSLVRRMVSLALVLSGVFVGTLLERPGWAATKTWNAGVNSTWDTAATVNWSGSTWANYDDASFAGAGTGTVTIAGSVFANKLSFTANGHTISGATLNMGNPGGIDNFNVGSGVTALITANIDQPYATAIQKIGAGTLVFSGTVTNATGNNRVEGGILRQNGGSWTGSGMYIADSNGSNGTFEATAGTVNMSQLSVVATRGTGTLTVNGGTINFNNGLYMGHTAATSANSAAINLSSGSLKVGNAGSGEFLLGQADDGGSSSVFTQTGGSFTFSGSNLYIGNMGAGMQSISVSAGTFTSTTNSMLLAVRGTASLTLSGNGSVSLPGLQFGHGSTSGATGNLNLNGGTLTIGAGGITKAGSNTANFNFNGGTLMASASFTMSGLNTAPVNTTSTIDTQGNMISISQNLTTGTGGGLIKKGIGGTLVLTGSNSYTGGTSIDEGTVSFGSGGLGSSGAITMNGGTLQWNGSNTQDVSSRITLVNAKTATFDTNGNNVTFATAIGGATTGAVVKTGNGSLTLSGNNTYTGGTTVNAGTLRLTGTNNGTAAILGTLTINAGGTAVVAGHDVFGYSNVANRLNVININGGVLDKQVDTINETLTGVQVNLTGGTWQATTGFFQPFSNGFGNTTINSLASSTTSTISTRLDLRQANLNTDFTVASGTTASGIDLLVSGQITEALAGSGITKLGAGTLALSTASNSYSGGTKINAGVLRVGTSTVGTENAAALGTGAVSIINGALLRLSPGSTSNTYTFNNSVSLGDATTSGSIWEEDGNQVFAGGLTVNAGGGTLYASYTNKSLVVNSLIGGSGTLTIANNGTGSGGRVYLTTTSNNYSGGTVINPTGDNTRAITLYVGNTGNENAGALGSGLVTVNTGGTLWFNPGSTATTYNIANSFDLNGGTIIGEDGNQRLGTGGGATFNVGAAGGTVQASWSGKDVYIDGQMTGSGALLLSHGPTAGSAATIHITNNTNTYSGTVSVSGAGNGITLSVDAANALQNATVDLNPGTAGKMQLNTAGTTYTVAGLTGTAGTVQPNTGAGTYTLRVNNTSDFTYGGTLSNNGSGVLALTKDGAGTLALITSANSYSGGTTVSLGTLQIGNGGNENAGALGSGLVTVNTGGTLWFKPGSTATVYNFANSFALNGGTIIGEDGNQHLGTGGGATFNVGGSGGTVQASWSGKDVYIDGQMTGNGALLLSHGPTAGSAATIHITNNTNTYSGTVSVSGAGNGITLSVDAANALQNATVNLNPGTAGKMQLNTAGTTYTVAGLTGTAGTVQPNTGAGTYTLRVNNTSDFTYGGTLINNGSGVLALTKDGAGKLTLGNANSYTGVTTVNGGTLDLQNANAIGSSSKLILNTAGTPLTGVAFNLQAAPNTHTTGVDLEVNAAVSLSQNITIAGGTSNTRGFSLGGSGTLTYSGVMTPYNGAMGLKNTATLKLDPGGSISLTGTGGNQIIFADSGTTLMLNGGSFSSTGNNGSNSAFLYNLTMNSGTASIGGASSTQVSLLANGTVALNGGSLSVQGFSGASSNTVNFNGGTLTALASNANFLPSPIVAKVDAGGAKINTNGLNPTISAELIHNTSGPATDGGLTKSGSGTLTLNYAASANTYNGGTTVNGGTLALGGTNNGFSTVGTGTLTINSGATVKANAANVLGHASDANVPHIVINAGTLTPDQYLHVKTIEMTAGTISAGNSAGGDGLDFQHGTRTVTVHADPAPSSIAAKMTTRNSGIGYITFDVENGAAASDLNVSGQIVGNGGIRKEGAGTMTLTNGNNTFSGGTTVNAGTLTVAVSGNNTQTALGVGRQVTVNSNGTLRLANGDALGYYAGNPNTLTINGGVLTTAAGIHHSVGYFGITLNGGTITSEGAGDATGNYLLDGDLNTLANANSSIISAQTVALRGGNPTGPVTFNVADGAAAIDLDVSASLTQSGVTSVTKSNSGLMRLTGTSTYTAPTTVQGGTLQLDAGGKVSNTSSITVGNSSGNGTLLVTTTGPHQLGTGEVVLGSTGGSTGTFNLQATGGTVSLVDSLVVGDAGVGIVNHASGVLNIGNGDATDGIGDLILGRSAGAASSSYDLAGGSVTADNVYIGQSGGTLGSPHLMSVGPGTTLTALRDLVVGAGGYGRLAQNGGTVNVQGVPTAIIGDGSTGTYDLDGGGLLAIAGNAEVGTNGGNGTMNHNDGTVTVGQNLTVGDAGSTGVYNLANNAANSLTVTGSEFIGVSDGIGTFTQSGGTHVLNGPSSNLTIGASGQFNLAGGTLDFRDYVGAGAAWTPNNASTITTPTGGQFSFTGGNLYDVSTITVSNGSNFTQEGGNFYIGQNGTGPAAVTTINGGFSLVNGILHLDAFGVDATPEVCCDGIASLNDQLTVTGDATLDSVVNIDFVGFTPVFGDVFTLICANDIAIGDNFALTGGYFRVVPTGLGPGQPQYALQAIVPEPASVAVWSVMGLLGLAAAYRARRRSGHRKS